LEFPKPEGQVGPITERRHKPGGQFDSEFRERRAQQQAWYGGKGGGWTKGSQIFI